MAAPAVQQQSLKDCKWYWKEETSANTDFTDWHECVIFPTVIHHELEEAKLIQDPFVADNERKIQWVGRKDWAFKTTFSTPPHASGYSYHVLAFDGLDTVAKVFLNGEVILECDNMFTPYRIDVTGKLKKTGEDNYLYITFESNARVAEERAAKYGEKYPVFSEIRAPDRVWMRKAQYHWGWDWGPEENTAGPYKDIRLELFNARIADVHVTTNSIAQDAKEAQITTDVEFDGKDEEADLEIAIIGPDDQAKAFIRSTVGLTDGSIARAEFAIKDPSLWWPAGQGEQPLYTVKVNLLRKDGVLLQEHKTTFGIRQVKLIQRPLNDAPGETFFFEINGRPIYICGTNWVPSHNQTPKVTEEGYFKWIEWAKRNNNNMIRIWGGGYFEHDAFYEACDKAGILIWHDFMTACGVYPTPPWLLQSVDTEVREQVTRLRNHPSIALWCGNNEDFMIADARGLKYDLSDMKGPWDKTAMPQREIYYKIWPEICKELTPEIPYWPSSPFGGPTANDPTIGDVHEWNVWHGKQLPYQQFGELGGRFVSEFGMHGFPDLRTIMTFNGPDKKTLYPNSKMMDAHNKSRGAENKMGRYLWENFQLPTTLDAFVYLSQLLQAEALDHAVISWRRQWKGPGQELNAGSIIWQLNDSNPTTSWALVDHYFRPKPAFFTTRRAFAPISVGISRTPVWHFLDEDHKHDSEIPAFEVWGSNLTQEVVKVEVRFKLYDVTHKRALESPKRQTFTLKPNSTTELTTFKPADAQEDSYVVLCAGLYESTTGAEVCRKVSWPEPYRYLDLPEDSSVEIKVDGEKVTLTCGHFPVKGLVAYVHYEDGEEAEWEDNMWDLMPGDVVSVTAKGLGDRQVHLRHLANSS